MSCEFSQKQVAKLLAKANRLVQSTVDNPGILDFGLISSVFPDKQNHFSTLEHGERLLMAKKRRDKLQKLFALFQRGVKPDPDDFKSLRHAYLAFQVMEKVNPTVNIRREPLPQQTIYPTFTNLTTEFVQSSQTVSVLSFDGYVKISKIISTLEPAQAAQCDHDLRMLLHSLESAVVTWLKMRIPDFELILRSIEPGSDIVYVPPLIDKDGRVIRPGCFKPKQ